MRKLQRLDILNQDALLCGDARSGHDRSRRGEPERAGAGDHQNRHGVNQRQLTAAARPPPTEQRDQRQYQNHRHKHCGDLIDQALNRRLGHLRVFDQTDDVREYRFAAGGGDPHQHTPVTVNTARRELVVDVFLDRQRLARQHRFVHLRTAFLHHTVGRKALARTNRQRVTNDQFGHWHVRLCARFCDHLCNFGPQRVQRANRGRRLSFGARL